MCKSCARIGAKYGQKQKLQSRLFWPISSCGRNYFKFCLDLDYFKHLGLAVSPWLLVSAVDFKDVYIFVSCSVCLLCHSCNSAEPVQNVPGSWVVEAQAFREANEQDELKYGKFRLFCWKPLMRLEWAAEICSL